MRQPSQFTYWSAAFLIGCLQSLEISAAPLLFVIVQVIFIEQRLRSPSAEKVKFGTIFTSVFIGACLTKVASTAFWLISGLYVVTEKSWFLGTSFYVIFLISHAMLQSGSIAIYLLLPKLSQRTRIPFAFLGAAVLSSGLGISSVITFGELASINNYFAKLLPFIGTLGLTLFGALVVGILLSIIYTSPFGRRRYVAGTFLLILLAAGFDSSYRVGTVDGNPGGESLDVLLLQNNLKSAMFSTNSEMAQANLRFYKSIGPAFDATIDLVVSPESAMPLAPFVPLSDLHRDLWSRLRDISPFQLMDQFGFGWIFVSATNSLSESPSEFSTERVPASFFMDHNQLLSARIPKMHLLPFIEYNPLPEWLGMFRAPKSLYFSPEKVERNTFQYRGFNLSTLICYDSLFRDGYRLAVRDASDALFVLTSDFELGERGAQDHRIITQARSLEFGVPTYFVGNAGFTGPIGEPGEDWDTSSFRRVNIKKFSGKRTFYSYNWSEYFELLIWGLAWVYFCFFLLAIGLRAAKFLNLKWHR